MVSNFLAMESANNESAQIGVIGLAVMGSNLARNFASRGIRTAVFNRTYQRTLDLLNAHGKEGLIGFEKIEDFIASLEKPRRMILMVQAGAPIDDVLNQLLPLLDKGDYVIDGGNSFFEDTERRHRQAAEKGVNFLGMGISGGEEGALLGPSLMPGLSQADWQYFEGLLGQIAAKDFEGKPCVTPIGPGGAGHYVKMVHNGIEYAMMQLIAEIYDFNRKAKSLSAPAIADIFTKANQGKSSSFLAEITAKVLNHQDSKSGKPLVDMILDKAAQKGTGGWTSIESIKLGAGAEMIGEAVTARSLSSFRDLRLKLNGQMDCEYLQSTVEINWDNVLYMGILVAYLQGLFLIKLAAENYKWPINLAEVCRIWQGGCIIRSKLLIELREAFLKNSNIRHLLENDKILGLVSDNLIDWENFVIEATKLGVAIPAAASAQNYLLSITDKNTPANLIQGLRDFFGAHTFERTDQSGIFHENWNN